MRATLITLFCALAFYCKAMPTDTITVWHLDYNDAKKLDLFLGYETINTEINVSKDTLTAKSNFSIHQATGCIWQTNIPNYFAVFDHEFTLIKFAKGIGTHQNLTLSFNPILEYHEQTGETTFQFYKIEGNLPSLNTAHHVITINLVD